jgi:violaxanthin de-epoxidase
VGAFNTCAVTKNKCVSQIPDDGEIVVPTSDKLVAALDTKDLEGRWYIASGLNKLFDIFDCQVRAHPSTE